MKRGERAKVQKENAGSRIIAYTEHSIHIHSNQWEVKETVWDYPQISGYSTIHSVMGWGGGDRFHF